MKSDTRKIINSMLALAMTTAVFTGCSRKVDDVDLPSKPEVVTSDTSEPSNSEPPVTTSEPVDPGPVVSEPEPEPAAPDTTDPNCPPRLCCSETLHWDNLL